MIPLFGILPLCLCNSIGGCISKSHQGTNKNSSRPTSSWNSSSFLIHLFISAPPSTSAEDKTHFGFRLQQLFSFRSSSLKLSVLSPCSLPSFGAPRLPLYAMAARIDCSRAWLGLNKVAHCPSICHALQVGAQPWAECQFSSVRPTMTHVLRLKSGEHYANSINAMCIARPEI